MRFRLATAASLFVLAVALSAGSSNASEATIAPSCSADDADLQRFAAVRREEGFNSDMNHVRAVSCPADADFDGSVGIPLSGSETAELRRRSAAGETFSAITEQELAHAADRFSGIWMEDDGVVTVAYLDDGSDRLAAVRELLPDDIEVRLHRGAGTQARLDEIYRRYMGSIAALREQGVEALSSSGDIVEGTYTIYIAEDSAPDAEERIAEAVGGWDSLVVKRDDEGAVDFLNARDTPTGRAYGGTSIGRVQGSTFWTCTASPSAKSAANLYYTVTSAHCGHPGWSWFQGYPPVYQGATLGPGQGNTLYPPPSSGTTDCDCQGIGPVSSTKRTSGVLLSSNAVYLYHSTPATEGSYFIGRDVCLSGARSWQVYGQNLCGEIVDLTGSAVATPYGVPITIYDQIVADITGAVGGDSGAPVGDGRTWLGILSGNVVSTGYAQFSRTTRMEARLNIDFVNLGY